MRNFNPILMLVAGCLLLAPVANAGNDAHSHAAEVAALMSRYSGEVPGASLVVLRNDKPVLRRAWGYADLEDNTRASPASNYRLASVSKQFTAAAILLLHQDGKLALTDSVRKWLPELPRATQKITLADLLAHRSGLVDYEDLIAEDRGEQVSDADVLRLIASQHALYFAPGAAHRYSNGGYVLLGLVVERVTHKDLAEFMHERIFAPLGMHQTLLYEHRPDQQIPHRAFGYSHEQGKWVRRDQSLTSATRGDGGVYSSVDDLAKWLAALESDKLLDADSRKLFMTARPPADDPDVNYGFGWRIGTHTVWKSGETMGFRNVVIRWPDQHLAVILLSNRRTPRPYPLALAIGELFLTD